MNRSLSRLALTWLLPLVATACRGDNPTPPSEGALNGSGGNTPWVRWPTLTYAEAGGELAKTRARLLAENMIDTNDANAIGVDPVTRIAIVCDERSRRARTLDGSCNSFERPAVGMRGMAFGRNVRERATFPERNDRGELLVSPIPASVADRIFTRRQFIPAPSINVLAAAWIQFMTHDWFSHTTDDLRNHPTERVELGGGRRMHATLKHPAPPKNLIDGVKDASSIAASDPKQDSTTGGKLDFVGRNLVTHWWDGSQVYGWDANGERRVRAFRDGLLKLGRGDSPDLLPIDPETGHEVAGFRGGWWVGISVLHHLFAREHNHVARELKARNPTWDDERLYDTARLIVVALMAKIHTIEWTPALIAHPISVAALQANWNGRIDPAAAKRAFDTFRAANPEAGTILDRVLDSLGGIVGGTARQDGVDYTLTEEFTSVYRMHPLLPDVLHDVGGRNLALSDTVGPGSVRVTSADAGGFKSILRALGTSNAGALTLDNHPSFLRHIPVATEGGIVLDMAAVDIARDRERGVPRYNKFRTELGLGRLTTFDDFIDRATLARAEAKGATSRDKDELARQRQIARDLEQLYGGDIDSVDLLAGSLAENTRPEGFGFGETSFQIFILNASRRLLTDRFFNEAYTAEYYTQWGLDWIASQSMGSLLTRHFNEDGELGSLLRPGKNAFTPWTADVPVPILKVRNKLR